MVALFLIAFAIHQAFPAGGGRFTRSGAVAAFVGVCLGMGVLVFAIGRAARFGRLDRRLHAIWAGRLGQILFRLGCWRLDLPSSVPSATGSHDLLALLDSLRHEPRGLRAARATLKRPVEELERLKRREEALASAVAEAKVAGPAESGTANPRRQAPLDDLELARRDVLDCQAAILSVLENVRLAMVRVKGGIGSTQDLERELAQGATLPK